MHPEYEPYSAQERSDVADYFEGVLADKGLAVGGDPELVIMQPIPLAQYRRLIETLRQNPIDKAIGEVLFAAFSESESPLAPVIVTALASMEDDHLIEVTRSIRELIGLDPDDDREQEFLDSGPTINIGTSMEKEDESAVGFTLDNILEGLKAAGASPELAEHLERSPANVAAAVVPSAIEVPKDLLEAHNRVVAKIGEVRANRLLAMMSEQTGHPASRIFIVDFQGDPAEIDVEAGPAGAPHSPQDDGLEILRRLGGGFRPGN